MSNLTDRPTSDVDLTNGETARKVSAPSAATKPVEGNDSLDLREKARGTIDPEKCVVTEVVGKIFQSGSSDQLRGYANEAVGKTKLALGLAVQSPELAVAGIAQSALGEVQKFVGEAKLAEEMAQTVDEDRNSAEPPSGAGL